MVQYEIELIIWDTDGQSSSMTLTVEVDSSDNQTSIAMLAGLTAARKFLLPQIEIEINGCRKIKNSNFND